MWDSVSKKVLLIRVMETVCYKSPDMKKSENGPTAEIIKQDPRTMLSCASAVAEKGIRWAESQLHNCSTVKRGNKNYMVDIGGEVVVKGKILQRHGAWNQ